jgi:hypothetical protein
LQKCTILEYSLSIYNYSQIRKWAYKQWTIAWEKHRDKIPPDKRPTAYRSRMHPSKHEGLTRAESSLVIQLYTEKTGLRAFIYNCKVPGITATCTCRHLQQTVKHAMLFCPDQGDYTTFLTTPGSTNLHYILSNRDALCKTLPWFLRQGLLPQFQLALPVLTAIEDRAERNYSNRGLETQG